MPAYYRAMFSEFLDESESEIIGQLTIKNGKSRFPLAYEQIDAWKWQLPILQDGLRAIILSRPASSKWSVLLEYPIPLLGYRIDCVLLCGTVVLVIEFKTGEDNSGGIRQVEDYALNLSNFHEGSHQLCLVPVVIRGHSEGKTISVRVAGSKIASVAVISGKSFPELLESICDAYVETAFELDAAAWDAARFKPVPPIIEAAVRLYEGKDIFAIDHACAPADSLERASSVIASVVSAVSDSKAICFVTGVPGAGKTLVGLNAAHSPLLNGDVSFLSGNGPLVKVIREALLRDAKKKRGLSRKVATPEINAFIHNVHRFAEEYDAAGKIPVQATIIFDEAQRAWDKEENMDRFDRNKSEPEMLLEIMDRRPQAVIVALIGGGQEINSGEAGIAEWGRALQAFPNWKVYASPEVIKGDSATAGFRLFEGVINPVNNIEEIAALHLNTSIRSIRGQFISNWVNAILEGRVSEAAEIVRDSEFKIHITRRLSNARQWLKAQRRGSQNSGLVGSAAAARLRADGLEYSFGFHKEFKWEHWFLDDESDARSCNKLEVFATQFEIQGLELDWVGVCWGEDFVFTDDRWTSMAFRSTKWKPMKNERKHFFRKNGYRVLLTRARQGMIIYVPSPHSGDTTRSHSLLDSTYQALLSAGAVPLQ
jgi:hypothetical protein